MACYTKSLFKGKNGKNKVDMIWNSLSRVKKIYLHKKNEFHLVTDRVSLLIARFEGKKVKWLNTFENKKAIGFLIKRRFINCELTVDVNYVCEDSYTYGIITSDTLRRYGGDKVYLKKNN